MMFTIIFKVSTSIFRRPNFYEIDSINKLTFGRIAMTQNFPLVTPVKVVLEMTPKMSMIEMYDRVYTQLKSSNHMKNYNNKHKGIRYKSQI